MNPLTNVRNQNKLNARELEHGIAGNDKKSWHQKYADSAWIFVGGMDYTMTEGDVICVFSQYGEVVNLNMIRDRKTGKSKGYAFLCYEDQRSTILSVDNMNGAKVAGRVLRVDHVEEYKVPKLHADTSDEQKDMYMHGCAPQAIVRPADVHEAHEKEKDDDGPKKKKHKKEKKAKRSREGKEKDRRSKDDDGDSGLASGAMTSSSSSAPKATPSYYDRSASSFIKREPSDTANNEGRWTQHGQDRDTFGDSKRDKRTDDAEQEDIPEHRVTMNYWDLQRVKERYNPVNRTQITTTDWREQEIFKMERDREKRMQGQKDAAKNSSYVPRRFQ